MINKRVFLFFLLLICSISVRSQTSSGIQSIITSMDTLRSRLPAEKLYIQFDKPYYSAGDTIWMKAYLFDAAFLSASEKSGIAYIELVNDTNKVLLQQMLPLSYGLGAGNMVLNKDDVPEGSYTVRAYTNLMRNFGENMVFRKSFYVSSSSVRSWLVNSTSILSKQSGTDNLRLDLQFNQFNKEALRMHDLELRVLDGKRVLLRDKVQTDIDGKLDVNFNLPEKTNGKNISIVAIDSKDDTRKLTIPIPVNRPEKIDLQFMSEGGNLVNGIPSKIGFKAIGEDGKGVEISGKVYSSSVKEPLRDNQEVAAFNSSYRGMGSFELTAKEGESYTAKLSINGITKDFPLPAAKSNGTTIRVNNFKESDSIQVIVSSSLPSSTIPYYLLAQSRGIICYGAIIRINGNTIKKQIAKSLFPTGIAKFTLMSADRQPLNERIVYIDHHDNLNITMNPGKPGYETRDSIGFAIDVKDHDGKPVQGSFSIAVTDDTQVRIDSLNNNILTSMLLTSDVKGNIEDPGHYFQAAEQSWRDLDHLLLTQGWIGYDWKDVFNPPEPQYVAEPEFMVKGRVSNVFNKNSAETGIRLISVRPVLFKDALTGKDGSFRFSGFPPADTLKFLIQARNKKDKSFNVGIEVDEFKPQLFMPSQQHFMPWYVNSDTTLLKYIQTGAIQQREQMNLPEGVNILEEVVITRKKTVAGSKNLNGSGNADLVLDQKDMEKAKKLSLFDVLKQRGLQPYMKEGVRYWVFKNHIVFLVIDGSKLLDLPFEEMKTYLDFYAAEDIKGIEFMSSIKYKMAYDPKGTIPAEIGCLHCPPPPVWLEITTWDGNGSLMKKIAGTYLYKSLPFAGRQQFYRPKYAVKDIVGPKDLRSTVHWEPNVITDKDGKAFVSFYSADSPGTYSVIMEGSDMNGNIGRQTGTITIK